MTACRLLFGSLGFRRVLLRVNHDAFERVDRAEHLRVARFDDLLVFFRLNALAAAQREEGAFLFRAHRHANVRRNAVAVHDLLARGVVFGGGKTQGRCVGQLHHILHRTFSEGRFAHNHGAVQIFERAADNLRSAGAAFIGQNRHRKLRTRFRDHGGRVFTLLRSDPALRRNDFCIRRQKLPAHIHRTIQKPTRIIPKIENQRLHPLLLQVIERPPQLIGGGFVELNEPNVSNLVGAGQFGIEQTRALDALHFYFYALERVLFDLLGRGPQESERHLAASRAAQTVDRILQVHFFGRRAVDFENLIARENARFGRRRVFHRGDDGRQTAFDRDFNTEPVKSAPRIVLHVAKIVRFHELAVRIERGEHSFHRRGDQVVISRFVSIDIILSNQLDGFGKDRDLRITVVFCCVRRSGVMQTQTKHDGGQQKANQRAKRETLFHLPNLVPWGSIAYRKFLATRKGSTTFGAETDCLGRKVSLLALLLSAAVVYPTTVVAAQTPDSEYEAVAEEYIKGYFAARPLQGTAIGLHEYDAKITDYSRLALD